MTSDKPYIRPARNSDKEAVMRFTEHTWDFGDYLSEVWDDWLREPNGKLLVVTLKRQPVAVGHVLLLSAGEAWIEGLRVDPSWRCKGLATLLVRRCMSEATWMGAGVIRFLTSSANTPIRHLSDNLGFKRLFSFQACRAGVLNGVEGSLQKPSMGDLPLLVSFLGNSAMLKAFSGLYSTGWRFQNLDASHLGKKIKEDMLRIVRQSGDIGALAVIEIGYREELVISYADGSPDALADLASELRKEAARMGLQSVYVRLPDLPLVFKSFRQAGYQPEEDKPFWIYEKAL